MNPGKMNARITFIKLMDTEQYDRRGFPVTTWNTVKNVWAQIKTQTAREFWQASQFQNQNEVRFIIRYTKGISPDMRIVYKEKIYEITGIMNDDELNVSMTVFAKELVQKETGPHD